MYGHIHVILKDLILSLAGPATWNKILQAAGLETDTDILDTVVHDDAVTVGLVVATAKVLNLSVDDALAAFGRHFVAFTLRSGNAHFLKMQGTTFPQFLANINRLHDHLERDHPDARFPFIETKYNPKRDVLELVYLSSRSGLAALLKSVVEEVGRSLYGLDVSFEDIRVPASLQDAHEAGRAAAWLLTWKFRPGGPAPPIDPRSLRPRMDFLALHEAMAQFVRLVSGPIICCSPQEEPVPEFMDILEDVTHNEDAHSPVLGGLLPSLMRSVKAAKVAAAWCDETLPRCRDFWNCSSGSPSDFRLSQEASVVDVFISHCWSQPENWALVMGSEVSHGVVKSNVLAIMAKDVALQKEKNLNGWTEVTFWVDKACIPQGNARLKARCISMLEEFIERCNSVCVIFTWTYLERMWCVYEWACFLLSKDPSQITLLNDVFVSEKTLQLYLDGIRYFGLERTKCELEADRLFLKQKIDTHYASVEAFEQLVQATSVALMARSMAYRAGSSEHIFATLYTPWVELARELGFSELASSLASCRPKEWREHSTRSASAASSAVGPQDQRLRGVSAREFHTCINEWFDSKVSPLLLSFRFKTCSGGRLDLSVEGGAPG